MEHWNTRTPVSLVQYIKATCLTQDTVEREEEGGEPMRGMMMHFALGAALAHGLGKPVAYRYPTDAASLKKGKTVVQVENSAANEAVVYAVQGFRRQRLGLVHGQSVTRFAIPEDMVHGGQQLRFMVDAVGLRDDSVSDAITVGEGERVNLFIPPF